MTTTITRPVHVEWPETAQYVLLATAPARATADDAGRQADVAVVGAGLAGLSAARVLAAAGGRVLVHEARDRVGQRLYTRPAADGTPLDLGSQWIRPTQRAIGALARAVGVPPLQAAHLRRIVH